MIGNTAAVLLASARFWTLQFLNVNGILLIELLALRLPSKMYVAPLTVLNFSKVVHLMLKSQAKLVIHT